MKQNKQKFTLEVWEQKTISREKVSTQEYQFPVPYIPVGAKYVFGNSPTRVVDSFVKTTTVREDNGQVWEQGIPTGTDQVWVDYLTQVIVVEFQK